MTKKAQRPKSKAFVVIKAESGGSTTSIADDNEKRLNQNTIWGMGWGPKHFLTTFFSGLQISFNSNQKNNKYKSSFLSLKLLTMPQR